MNIIGDRGTLFALADDVNIVEPLAVHAEIVAQLPALAMSEAWLKTQASKNRDYVQSSTREAWTSYLNDNPHSSYTSILCINDILDGRNPPPEENDDSFYDHSILPTWHENDGVNILGTPLGSLAFVKDYLGNKLKRHKLLLSFIVDVSKISFSREAHKMLSGPSVPRLTDILKSMPKDFASNEWIHAADEAHLTTWIECNGASTPITTLSVSESAHLAASLDLPPQFGGVGLHSLIRVADEELLGSWASTKADLIAFCRSKELSVYAKKIDALDSMADRPDKQHEAPPHPAVTVIVSTRAHAFLESIPQVEIDFTTYLIMSERTVQIPGRYPPP